MNISIGNTAVIVIGAVIVFGLFVQTLATNIAAPIQPLVPQLVP